MTPEDVLAALCHALGDDEGSRAWLVVDGVMAGQRIYWPRRIGRDLTARAVYEMHKDGKSITAICARVNLSRATVYRLIKAELIRHRRLSQDLPKTGEVLPRLKPRRSPC